MKIKLTMPKNEKYIYQDMRILIEGLSRNLHEGHLYEIFGNYGKIKLVDLPKDYKTEFHCGFAYIEYEHDQDNHPVQKAIDSMNDGQIDGLVITVQKTSNSSLNSLDRYKDDENSSSSYCSTCSSSLSSISCTSSSSFNSPYRYHNHKSYSSPKRKTLKTLSQKHK